jgi:type II secretory pathway predicted ATPase ExeA
MYENYWQLSAKPFEDAADSRFYYPAESHQAALLKLRYAVESRSSGALLAGASGLGKTLVADLLRDMLAAHCAPFARIVFPQMPTADLLAYLADEFDGGQEPGGDVRVQTSVRRIERFLTANAEQGRHAVLVIDEAHLLEDPQTFETLRLLLNLPGNGPGALTLLLSGQPAILPRLSRMPSWEERLGVKCLLRPFSEEETASYVAHRLRAAGARRTIIEHDALPTVHALTQGVARQINRLCDLGLLIGFAEERSSLSAEHFESVSRELVTVAPE